MLRVMCVWMSRMTWKFFLDRKGNRSHKTILETSRRSSAQSWKRAEIRPFELILGPARLDCLIVQENGRNGSLLLAIWIHRPFWVAGVRPCLSFIGGGKFSNADNFERTGKPPSAVTKQNGITQNDEMETQTNHLRFSEVKTLAPNSVRHSLLRLATAFFPLFQKDPSLTKNGAVVLLSWWEFVPIESPKPQLF